ncbi:hypothetical protein M2451_002709 [Dysgonomonas sp. PFB1-18]|nr:hypothetical protein [Dysgonomonas sp. PF1-14]MDH6339730.1 hypothetical protein [Dysgonomonas sp. PF1-16]MDH6381378.1 hypothetical protein [Dysgonomonas sp. PFB1-18]MDH6398593.1 hypothetical protein [Dysgonomonas sp. PF1-23]
MEYYLGYSVSHLSDREWAYKIKQLEHVRKKEQEASK